MRRRKRRHSRRRYSNARRRMRLLNRRHRRSRGRRRSYNGRRRGRGRRRSRNPVAVLKSKLGGLTAGYKPATLMKAVPVVGGVIGNMALSSAVSGYMPDMLKSGVGNYLVGLGTAGLLGMGVGMVSKQYAGPVFFGGVLEVMTRVAKQYVVPMLSKFIPGLSGLSPDFSDFADYLTPQNAADARPLGYFGDYLTPQAAADARPLGSLGDNDEYISEELASL